MSNTTLRARILSPKDKSSAEFIEDGILVINQDGIISEVCAFDGRNVDQDLRPNVLLPGFVDTHIHLPQFRAVGSATGPLLEWLKTSIFPEEAKFHDEEHAAQIAQYFVRSLAAAGTTSSLVYGSVHKQSCESLFQAAQKLGIRCIAGPVLMDTNSPDDICLPTESAITNLEELVDTWHGQNNGLLQVAVIPRFALACSMEMMKAAARIAKERDLLVTTHVSETLDECDFVCQMHKESDYLSIYEKAGLLHSKSVFAHCIHFSSNEWERFQNSGAAVAHCADSNFFLGSGRMDFHRVASRDIPMGIGSDVAAGRSFRIQRHLAATYDNALIMGKKLSEEYLLWYGTRGGALALGLDSVGQLKSGMEADMVCLEVPDFVSTPTEIMQWIFLDHDAPRPKATWVKGRQVWDRNQWAKQGASYVWNSSGSTNQPTVIS
eukprot:gb/GECH01014563.1/.p1 GENE.gb/GECH01014563.1/~~gb/GECH01014563.1/.p1  ORF type:complete len:435 (+),score=97.60 gb/GECH01014563.1/:1-1305(+)